MIPFFLSALDVKARREKESSTGGKGKWCAGFSGLVSKKTGKPESRIYRVFSHISDGEFVPPKKPELPCKIVILRCDCGNYTVIP